MLHFLRTKRRQGKPIRWIAERLGLDLLRVVAMAVNLRLVLPTTHCGRRCKMQPAREPQPLGVPGEIADEGLCRWIAADPRGPWAMCARPAVEGAPYCPHHKARAYAPRRPLVTNIAFVMAALRPAARDSQAQPHQGNRKEPASNPLGSRPNPGRDDEERRGTR